MVSEHPPFLLHLEFLFLILGDAALLVVQHSSSNLCMLCSYSFLKGHTSLPSVVQYTLVAQ